MAPRLLRDESPCLFSGVRRGPPLYIRTDLDVSGAESLTERGSILDASLIRTLSQPPEGAKPPQGGTAEGGAPGECSNQRCVGDRHPILSAIRYDIQVGLS